MKKYDDNIPLLKNRVETHAFIRNISKHRLPDGTLDVEGNLKLWNDGMQGFVKTPLWEKTPGWRGGVHGLGLADGENDLNANVPHIAEWGKLCTGWLDLHNLGGEHEKQ